jgi:hypothetical protein
MQKFFVSLSAAKSSFLGIVNGCQNKKRKEISIEKDTEI